MLAEQIVLLPELAAIAAVAAAGIVAAPELLQAGMPGIAAVLLAEQAGIAAALLVEQAGIAAALPGIVVVPVAAGLAIAALPESLPEVPAEQAEQKLAE